MEPRTELLSLALMEKITNGERAWEGDVQVGSIPAHISITRNGEGTSHLGRVVDLTITVGKERGLVELFESHDGQTYTLISTQEQGAGGAWGQETSHHQVIAKLGFRDVHHQVRRVAPRLIAHRRSEVFDTDRLGNLRSFMEQSASLAQALRAATSLRG